MDCGVESRSYFVKSVVKIFLDVLLLRRLEMVIKVLGLLFIGNI